MTSSCVALHDPDERLLVDVAAEEQAVAAVMPSGWFKAEDIRKMHTYREAIRGLPEADSRPVATVWVLYPGTEFTFFDEERGRLKALPDDLAELQGVGAIPLAPGEEPTLLRALLRRLVQSAMAGQA